MVVCLFVNSLSNSVTTAADECSADTEYSVVGAVAVSSDVVVPPPPSASPAAGTPPPPPHRPPNEHSHPVVLMLVQRLRRWTSFITTLVYGVLPAVVTSI